MKNKHLFAYYCTLLLPIGVLAGAGVDAAIDLPVALTLLGVVAGCVGSLALVRASETSSTR